MGRGAATLRGETQERWHEASATWAAMGGRIERDSAHFAEFVRNDGFFWGEVGGLRFGILWTWGAVLRPYVEKPKSMA